ALAAAGPAVGLDLGERDGLEGVRLRDLVAARAASRLDLLLAARGVALQAGRLDGLPGAREQERGEAVGFLVLEVKVGHLDPGVVLFRAEQELPERRRLPLGF